MAVGTAWAGKDFWVNVLASLALLGPGLLLTNIFAGQWRARRAWEREREGLARLASQVVAAINGDLMAPILDLYQAVNMPLPAPKPPDPDMLNVSPPAALAFVHLELDGHEKFLRMLVRVRRSEPPAWSDADLTSWLGILPAMEIVLARLDGRVRTAELRVRLNEWNRLIVDTTLPWKCGDQAETLTVAEARSRGPVRVDLSSALWAAADVVKAADDFVTALWTAIGERQPAEKYV